MRLLLLTSVLLTATLALASSAAAAIRHPTGAAQVVVRVTNGGGFVPVEFNLRALPSFTLYGDGTIVVPGPVIQIYPGPAIYPLVRSKLSERQVQALLTRAKQAGLLAPGAIDYGDMGSIGVADASTTTVFLNAAGRHLKREAYALGITAGSGRVTPAQVRARRALSRFIARLPQHLAGTPYTPRALAVYVGPYRGAPQAGAAPVVWPLESDLATAGKRPPSGLDFRCFTVSGNNTTTLLATLRKANERSRWKARAGGDDTYQVIARPLLPDQPGCS